MLNMSVVFSCMLAIAIQIGFFAGRVIIVGIAISLILSSIKDLLED